MTIRASGLSLAVLDYRGGVIGRMGGGVWEGWVELHVTKNNILQGLID